MDAAKLGVASEIADGTTGSLRRQAAKKTTEAIKGSAEMVALQDALANVEDIDLTNPEEVNRLQHLIESYKERMRAVADDQGYLGFEDLDHGTGA